MPISHTQHWVNISLERPNVSTDGPVRRHTGSGRRLAQLMRLLCEGLTWIRSSIAHPVVFPRAKGQWLPHSADATM